MYVASPAPQNSPVIQKRKLHFSQFGRGKRTELVEMIRGVVVGQVAAGNRNGSPDPDLQEIDQAFRKGIADGEPLPAEAVKTCICPAATRFSSPEGSVHPMAPITGNKTTKPASALPCSAFVPRQAHRH